jgi:hypothetical protein
VVRVEAVDVGHTRETLSDKNTPEEES